MIDLLDVLTARVREQSAQPNPPEEKMTQLEKSRIILNRWSHPTITVKEMAIAMFDSSLPTKRAMNRASALLSRAVKDQRVERIEMGIYRINLWKPVNPLESNIPQDVLEALNDLMSHQVEVKKMQDTFCRLEQRSEECMAELAELNERIRVMNEEIEKADNENGRKQSNLMVLIQKHTRY